MVHEVFDHLRSPRRSCAITAEYLSWVPSDVDDAHTESEGGGDCRQQLCELISAHGDLPEHRDG
jgi:hypothetical protein